MYDKRKNQASFIFNPAAQTSRTNCCIIFLRGNEIRSSGGLICFLEKFILVFHRLDFVLIIFSFMTLDRSYVRSQLSHRDR